MFTHAVQLTERNDVIGKAVIVGVNWRGNAMKHRPIHPDNPPTAVELSG